MDSTDSQSLSDDEMGRLVSIALEEFGERLDRFSTECATANVMRKNPALGGEAKKNGGLGDFIEGRTAGATSLHVH